MSPPKELGKGRSLSQAAAASLEQAAAMAKAQGREFVEPSHLLLALLQRPEILQLLELSFVSPDEVRLYAEAALPESGLNAATDNEPTYSAGLKKVLSFSAYEAWRFATDQISVRYLFLGLLRHQRHSELSQTLSSLGLELHAMREAVARSRKPEQKYPQGHPLNEAQAPAIAAIEAAHTAAKSTYCGQIDTLHLLIGLIDNRSEDLRVLLRHHGMDPAELRQAAVAAILSDRQPITLAMRFTPAAKGALERARSRATAHGKLQWDQGDLLEGLLLGPAYSWWGSFSPHSTDPASKLLQPLFEAVETVEAADGETERSHLYSTERVLNRAKLLAQDFGRQAAEPIDILLAIVTDDDLHAYWSLEAAGTDMAKVRAEAQALSPETNGAIGLSKSSMQLLDNAWDYARSCGRFHLGPEHLTMVLLEQADTKQGAVARALDGINQMTVQAVLNETPCNAPAALRVQPGETPPSVKEQLQGGFIIALIWSALELWWFKAPASGFFPTIEPLLIMGLIVHAGLVFAALFSSFGKRSLALKSAGRGFLLGTLVVAVLGYVTPGS